MEEKEKREFQYLAMKIIDNWMSEAKSNSEYWSESDEKMINNDLIDEMKELLEDMRS